MIAQAGDIPRGQLPATIEPQAYKLDLKLDPAGDRLHGHVEISVKNDKPLHVFYLNGKGLHVTSALIQTGGTVTNAQYTEVDPIGVAEIRLPGQLASGRHTVVIDYDASIDDGVFHAKVGSDWYAWSAFEPTGARTLLPSFDEPRFKTPFTISVQTHRRNLVISNGPEAGSVRIGDEIRHQFAATAPLPTYLLQVAVGPFATGSTTAAPTVWRKRPLPIRVFATRDKADQLAFALENMGPIERLIEAYIGQPLPFPKLDGVATPLWNGSALEDAGAILFSDDVFVGKGETDPRFVSAFATDVPHEISHQWFGDLVTPKWWDDLWLNESFAEWLGVKIARQWRPGIDLGSHDNSLAFVAMNMDSLAAVDALRSPVLTPDDQRFTPITYGKGAQVVRMVAGYLGDERFREGVRRYLAAHRYGSASADDFFAALGQAAKDPAITQAMRDFVIQPGVPVVTIERQGDRLVVRQQRYQMLGSDLPQEHWTIPFCYRVGDQRHCSMVTERTVLPVASGALVPNADGNGYYRFALEPAHWHALLAQSAVLPAGEALAVADSLWAQYRAGSLDSRLLLEGVQSLAAHPAPAVSLFGAKAMAQLASSGFIPGDALPDYRRFILSAYAPRLEALGFDPTHQAAGDEPAERSKLRADLLSVLVDAGPDAVLAGRLDHAVDAWLAGDANALDPMYRQAALKEWVRSHDLASAARLYDQLVRQKADAARSDALKALGASGNAAIGEWLLRTALADKIATKDEMIVLAGLAAWPATRAMAVEQALTEDGEKLANDDAAAHRMLNLTAGFCSAGEDAVIDNVLRLRMAGAGPGHVRLSRLTESAHDCTMLAAARQSGLVTALQSADGVPHSR